MPAFVQNAISTTTPGLGTSFTVSLPSVVSGNNIIVGVAYDVAMAITLTDSLGNLYQLAKDQAGLAQIWFSENVTGGSPTITLTTPSNNRIVLTAYEISGLSAKNSLNAMSGRTSTSSTVNSGGVTTTVPNTLLFVLSRSTSGVSAPTVGTSYGNLLSGVVTAGATSTYIASQLRIVSSIATYDGPFVVSQTSWSAVIVAFSDVQSPQAMVLNNYQSFDAADGMSISEKAR